MTSSQKQPPSEIGMDGSFAEAFVRSRRFFTPGTISDDLRTLSQVGGREADDFYRDRWSHDKVVRSTHGVNCTGSCSWKVYVKDGIITWETQQTDYPSVGPDSPEYELLSQRDPSSNSPLPRTARSTSAIAPAPSGQMKQPAS